MEGLTFCASSKVSRSKVKVTRPVWVAVQVTTCRGGGIFWRPHYRPPSLFFMKIILLWTCITFQRIKL